jgi:tetratricopeptide (TPR) repeat protein
MAAPLLTAALIVRDEARQLDGCLASLNGVVDEVVVVDTGSRDESVDVARAHGARVHHEPWQGDFSRARNAGLERTAGQWILYIDADERLRPTAREDVEALLAGSDAVAFRVLLHPHSGWTAYREYRLWRNDPRIRFHGIIHEKVVPAIEAVAAAEGRPIRDCALALDHLGYEGDQRRKHRRNLPLLRAELARDPRSIFNWCHLGAVLQALGETDEAERALVRAVELARAQPPGVEHGSLAYADLVRLRHERGDDVSELLTEALGRYPENWLLVWIKARSEIAAGRHEDALLWLDRLLHVDVAGLPDVGAAYDARLFGEFAHESRGLCLFRLGRYDEAAAAYAAAARSNPASLEHETRRRLAEARALSAQPPGRRRAPCASS